MRRTVRRDRAAGLPTGIWLAVVPGIALACTLGDCAARHFAVSGRGPGRSDAVALAWSAHALGYVVGDIKTGLALVDHALLLNANLAVVWQRNGWLRIYAGDCELAIEHLQRAMRLSPLDPVMQPGMQRDGICIPSAGKFGRGISLGRTRVAFAIRLASSPASTSDEQRPRRSGTGHQAGYDALADDPTAIAHFEPSRADLAAAAEHMARLVEAMRKAGLPE